MSATAITPFARPAERAPRLGALGQAAAIALLLLLASGMYLFLKWTLLLDGTRSPFVLAYSSLVTGYLGSRAVVAIAHRRRAPWVVPATLPSVTVIVPVKNEGLMIGRTVAQLFASGYPTDRLEVIVVDDGSTDHTTLVLLLARLSHHALKVITLPRNIGKRKAMAQGILQTESDIVIVIDSDTLIEYGAIHRIVAPFSDTNVAAVAGLTEILNEDTSLLTRVQALIYEISFRIHKMAESALGSVTCCPGCFSAYRRDAIAPLLDEWSSQRFLDDETIFGDDRALTMLLLREGWEVSFEPAAIARTDAPETTKGYLRQQLRWKKSWIQQGLRGCRFMWRRPPLAAVWFYLGFGLSFMGPHVLLRAVVISPLVAHAFPLRFLAGLFCVGTLAACYLCIVRSDLKRLRAVAALPFVGVVLTMQMPFAIARLADARWGTR